MSILCHVNPNCNFYCFILFQFNLQLLLNSNLTQGLNDVQMYGGVPPPPLSDPMSAPNVCPAPAPGSMTLGPDTLSSAAPASYLAPPPGFSDSDHSMSDTDSLGSEPGTFSRFGFSRVSKPRGMAVMDRMMPQVSNYMTLAMVYNFMPVAILFFQSCNYNLHICIILCVL